MRRAFTAGQSPRGRSRRCGRPAGNLERPDCPAGVCLCHALHLVARRSDPGCRCEPGAQLDRDGAEGPHRGRSPHHRGALPRDRSEDGQPAGPSLEQYRKALRPKRLWTMRRVATIPDVRTTGSIDRCHIAPVGSRPHQPEHGQPHVEVRQDAQGFGASSRPRLPADSTRSWPAGPPEVLPRKSSPGNVVSSAATRRQLKVVLCS